MTKNRQRTDRHTVQRLRPLYPLWILEGVGQLIMKKNKVGGTCETAVEGMHINNK